MEIELAERRRKVTLSKQEVTRLVTCWRLQFFLFHERHEITVSNGSSVLTKRGNHDSGPTSPSGRSPDTKIRVVSAHRQHENLISASADQATLLTNLTAIPLPATRMTI